MGLDIWGVGVFELEFGKVEGFCSVVRPLGLWE